MFKNLKSRFDSNINQIVTVGIDYEKMRLINLDDNEQAIPQYIKDKLKFITGMYLDDENKTILSTL